MSSCAPAVKIQHEFLLRRMLLPTFQDFQNPVKEFHEELSQLLVGRGQHFGGRSVEKFVVAFGPRWRTQLVGHGTWGAKNNIWRQGHCGPRGGRGKGAGKGGAAGPSAAARAASSAGSSSGGAATAGDSGTNKPMLMPLVRKRPAPAPSKTINATDKLVDTNKLKKSACGAAVLSKTLWSARWWGPKTPALGLGRTQFVGHGTWGAKNDIWRRGHCPRGGAREHFVIRWRLVVCCAREEGLRRAGQAGREEGRQPPQGRAQDPHHGRLCRVGFLAVLVRGTSCCGNHLASDKAKVVLWSARWWVPKTPALGLGLSEQTSFRPGGFIDASPPGPVVRGRALLQVDARANGFATRWRGRRGRHPACCFDHAEGGNWCFCSGHRRGENEGRGFLYSFSSARG